MCTTDHQVTLLVNGEAKECGYENSSRSCFEWDSLRNELMRRVVRISVVVNVKSAV